MARSMDVKAKSRPVTDRGPLNRVRARSEQNVLCSACGPFRDCQHDALREEGSRIGDPAGAIHIGGSEWLNQRPAGKCSADTTHSLFLGMHGRSLPLFVKTVYVWWAVPA